MKKIWVTADHHFGHANIIKYCNRPFSSKDEMDATMVAVWNSMVSDEDLVIHLGDVSLGSASHVGHILDKLKGKKVLVYGNHDRTDLKQHHSWLNVRKSVKMIYENRIIHMRHYPYHADEMNPGEIYLHGHCHGNMGTLHDGQIDVGVDCWNFSLILLDELIEFYNNGEV